MKQTDEQINKLIYQNEETTDCNDISFSSSELLALKELLQIKDKIISVVSEEGNTYFYHTIPAFDDLKPQTIHISQKVFRDFKLFVKDHNTTLRQAVSLALLHYMNSFETKEEIR